MVLLSESTLLRTLPEFNLIEPLGGVGRNDNVDIIASANNNQRHDAYNYDNNYYSADQGGQPRKQPNKTVCRIPSTPLIFFEASVSFNVVSEIYTTKGGIEQKFFDGNFDVHFQEPKASWNSTLGHWVYFYIFGDDAIF